MVKRRTVKSRPAFELFLDKSEPKRFRYREYADEGDKKESIKETLNLDISEKFNQSCCCPECGERSRKRLVIDCN